MPANANSPFLAERLIARLSPLRRSNLQRRITEHLEDKVEHNAAPRDADGLRRLEAMLGRLAALS